MARSAADLIVASIWLGAAISVVAGFTPDFSAPRPQPNASEASLSVPLQGDQVLVNRERKGDRLPLSSKNLQLAPVVRPTESDLPEKVPLGCDPAFSPIAEPGARAPLRPLRRLTRAAPQARERFRLTAVCLAASISCADALRS